METKIYLSKPCNLLLADVFFKGGFIESWGRLKKDTGYY
jgi:hypothetical protein